MIKQTSNLKKYFLIYIKLKKIKYIMNNINIIAQFYLNIINKFILFIMK